MPPKRELSKKDPARSRMEGVEPVIPIEYLNRLQKKQEEIPEFEESLSRVAAPFLADDSLVLASLSTVGNLPFRRICKEYGADATQSEMIDARKFISGSRMEWARLRRHRTEKIFGVQLMANSQVIMKKAAALMTEAVFEKASDDVVHYLELNAGCPNKKIIRSGLGAALLRKPGKLSAIVRAARENTNVPVTVKMRSGYDKPVAGKVVPMLVGHASHVFLHGRTFKQMYRGQSDWEMIRDCAKSVEPEGAMGVYGSGDILSTVDYLEKQKINPGPVLIARGALMKPWIFKEIKEGVTEPWDLSSTDRMEVLQRFANYGLDYWGGDDWGVNTTRKFLLKWLVDYRRYIPGGLLAEGTRQEMTVRVSPAIEPRDEMEKLLISEKNEDFLSIADYVLGPSNRAGGN